MYSQLISEFLVLKNFASHRFNVNLPLNLCNAHLESKKILNNLLIPGPEVIKLLSCSTQLSMKFQMLISVKLSRNLASFRLK